MRKTFLAASLLISSSAFATSGYECSVVRNEVVLYTSPRFEITRNKLMEFDFDPTNSAIYAQCELDNQVATFSCGILQDGTKPKALSHGNIPVGANELTISVGDLSLQCELKA